MNDPDDTRMRLRNNRLSYIWLIRQLALRGIATDKTEMSSVINGGRKGAKAELILKTSNSMLHLIRCKTDEIGEEMGIHIELSDRAERELLLEILVCAHR